MTTPATLPVDFLPREAHRLPGRLGLTAAPGRWRPGLDPSSDTLVADDLAWLRDHHGAGVIVTLLEEFEMRRLGISGLPAAVRRAGMESLWLPVQDMAAPADRDAASLLVTTIVQRLTGGSTVVVHCRGGLGRSGTIAACVLVRAGRTPADAIRRVRAARPGAVEVASQEAFVMSGWPPSI